MKTPVLWKLSEIWNSAFEEDDSRPLIPRDNLWASELGKAPIDLWLKLRAIKPTNPPNLRARRKFEAGNLTEWMVSLILSRAGVLINSQERCEFQYPDILKVTGKMDFLAGGRADPKKWEEESQNFPETFFKVGKKIVSYISENYPQGLEEKPLEIKSLSANMFDSLERRGTALKNHRLQTFHYLISTKRDKGSIVYLCRDDLRMREFEVYRDRDNESEYRNAIAEISKYHLSNTRPPLEKQIIFNEDTGKFSANYHVGYSPYLTMLYGLKDQSEFDDLNKPIVSRWNRVLSRLAAGERVTEKNQNAIDEIKIAGYDLKSLLPKFQGEEAA